VAGLLAVIRRRIEEARVYPETARQAGTQGTVELRFRIAGDGSVAGLEILRSSGSAALDAAGADAIRRAAPYPVVSGWIRLPLAFRLAEAP
jgi:protein TonB